MTLDVLILAGGRGSRIQKLWNGPKCLVPVGGRPVISRIIEAVAPLNPNVIEVVLGYNSVAAVAWLKANQPKCIIGVERRRNGTSPAFRWALRRGYVSAPLLVLNGDTIPLYDLAALVRCHEQRVGAWATAAVVHHVKTWRDVYAGACVLSDAALDEIYTDNRTRDFPAHLIGAQRFTVPGFLDVGTREGFQKAKEWTE